METERRREGERERDRRKRSVEVARRGETQAGLCTCLRETERNSERECYVPGDRKQERASDEDAAWKTGGAGRERRGEPGVREKERERARVG